jgi:hypothetical protein
MAIHHTVRGIDDRHTEGCELIVFDRELINSLSCRLDDTAMLAVLQDDFHPGVPGPLLVTGLDAVQCLSFGQNFIIGFDPKDIMMDDAPALGDLVIRDEELLLVAHTAGPRGRPGGRCMVNVDSGEVIWGLYSGPRIIDWSISIDSRKNGTPKTVVSRRQGGFVR